MLTEMHVYNVAYQAAYNALQAEARVIREFVAGLPAYQVADGVSVISRERILEFIDERVEYGKKARVGIHAD